MLTPLEAVNIARKKINNFVAETIVDYGDFYAIDNAVPFDTVDISYKIDKQTGEVTEFSFQEYIEAIKKFGDDDDPEEYSISELLKQGKRAS